MSASLILAIIAGGIIYILEQTVAGKGGQGILCSGMSASEHSDSNRTLEANLGALNKGKQSTQNTNEAFDGGISLIKIII